LRPRPSLSYLQNLIAQPLLFLLAPSLLDHLIRPLEQVDWHCQTEFFCRFEVNDEFKLRRLLDWKVSRLGASENLIHVTSRTALQVNIVDSIRHETALIDICPLVISSWQPASIGKLNDSLCLGEKISGSGGHHCLKLLCFAA
jgi:hypothetical protein